MTEVQLFKLCLKGTHSSTRIHCDNIKLEMARIESSLRKKISSKRHYIKWDGFRIQTVDRNPILNSEIWFKTLANIKNIEDAVRDFRRAWQRKSCATKKKFEYNNYLRRPNSDKVFLGRNIPQMNQITRLFEHRSTDTFDLNSNSCRGNLYCFLKGANIKLQLVLVFWKLLLDINLKVFLRLKAVP